MKFLWTAIYLKPIYNALIALVSVMPFASVGLAIIVITVIVKLLIYPFTKSAMAGQAKMQFIQGEIEAIKKAYPDKKIQAEKTFELYKLHKANPFSGCIILIFVQFPVFFALYYAVTYLSNPVDYLYPFVHMPTTLNMQFLHYFDLSKPHVVFAVLAAATQFVQLKLSMSKMPKPTGEGFQAEFAGAMQKQMMYVLPVIIVVAGMKFPGAVAIYWITSNIVTIVQEYFIRKSVVAAPSEAIRVI